MMKCPLSINFSFTVTLSTPDTMTGEPQPEGEYSTTQLADHYPTGFQAEL